MEINSTKVQELIACCLKAQIFLNKTEASGILIEPCTNPNALGSIVNSLDNQLCKLTFRELGIDINDDESCEEFFNIIRDVHSIEDVPRLTTCAFQVLCRCKYEHLSETRVMFSVIEYSAEKVFVFDSVTDLENELSKSRSCVPPLTTRLYNFYIGKEKIRGVKTVEQALSQLISVDKFIEFLESRN